MPMPVAVNSLDNSFIFPCPKLGWGMKVKHQIEAIWLTIFPTASSISIHFCPRALQKQKHALATPRKNNFHQQPDPLHKVTPGQPSATQPAQDVLQHYGSHLCEKINEPSISQPVHSIIAGHKHSEGAWPIQDWRQATVLQKQQKISSWIWHGLLRGVQQEVRGNIKQLTGGRAGVKQNVQEATGHQG